MFWTLLKFRHNPSLNADHRIHARERLGALNDARGESSLRGLKQIVLPPEPVDGKHKLNVWTAFLYIFELSWTYFLPLSSSKLPKVLWYVFCGCS